MPIKASDLNHEIVFSYLDEKTGAQTDIATERLFNYCVENKLEIFTITIEPDYAEHCLHNRGIEQHRLDRLSKKICLSVPLLHCDWGNGAYVLVDGNHRYVKLWQLGVKFCNSYLIPKETWEQFRIIGMREFTEQQLRTMRSGI